MAVLAAATVAAYSNSLDGEFQFDDTTAVVENLAIRDLGVFLRGHFLQGFASGRRPVTDLTLAVDYALGGLDVAAYHATNVLLHLAVVALVFFFTRRTLRRLDFTDGDALSWWIAGLFALHPVHSQAVAYVAQRSEVLASAFYVAALLLLLHAEERRLTARGVAYYVAALLSFALGLGAKPVIATLPAAYLLYGVCFSGPRADERAEAPLRSPWPFRLALAAPFIAIAAIAVTIQLGGFRGSQEAGFGLTSMGPWRYFLTQLPVVVRYLRLLVWPAGQNLDYAFTLSDGLLELRTAASGIALAALAAGAAVLWRRSRSKDSEAAKAMRFASFGLAWFLLILSPTSSFIPIVDVIEEHRVYLASWGILSALAAAGVVGYRRCAGDSARARRGAVAIVLGTWTALGVGLHLRNEVWRTRLSLWRDVVAKSPTKARAHSNLAGALSNAGDSAGAVEEYRLAMRYAEDGTVARSTIASDMGRALLRLDRVDAAISVLRGGLALAPGDGSLANSLAIALLSKGDLEGAGAYARQAVDRAPHSGTAHHTLGEALMAKGDFVGALQEFSVAASLEPNDPLHVYFIAVNQERLGLIPQACGSWGRLLALGGGTFGSAEARDRRAALGCVAPGR